MLDRTPGNGKQCFFSEGNTGGNSDFPWMVWSENAEGQNGSSYLENMCIDSETKGATRAGVPWGT